MVALQLASDVTAQGKNGLGVLAFQGIADGILTDAANAAAQRALAAFGLDAMQSPELACTSEEDGREDSWQGVIPVASAVRQGGQPGKEIQHRIEIFLELVSTQAPGLPFLPPLLLLLATQQATKIDTTDGSGGLLEALVQFHLPTGLVGQLERNVDGAQLALG